MHGPNRSGTPLRGDYPGPSRNLHPSDRLTRSLEYRTRVGRRQDQPKNGGDDVIIDAMNFEPEKPVPANQHRAARPPAAFDPRTATGQTGRWHDLRRDQHCPVMDWRDNHDPRLRDSLVRSTIRLPRLLTSDLRL